MLCRTFPTRHAMNPKKGDSVAQGPRFFRFAHPLAFGVLLLVLAGLSVLTAFGIAPGMAPDDVARTWVEREVPLADWAASTPQPQTYVTQERVLPGDTVAAILDRLGVRDAPALDFMRGDRTGRLIFRQLVPGRVVQAKTDADGALVTLRYFASAGNLLEIARTKDGFSSRQRTLGETPRLVYKTGVIDSSLFAA